VPYLLQCLKRCAVPAAVPQEMCRTCCSASKDVPHLLQCFKRCAVPAVVPQEMCRTCCSASRDVPHLLQCLKRCAVYPAMPCCAARHFITFRTQVTDSRCLQSVFQSVDSVDNLVVLRCDRQSFSFTEQLHTTDPNILRLLVRIMWPTVMQCRLSPFACCLLWPLLEGRLQPWGAADLGQCNSHQLGLLLGRGQNLASCENTVVHCLPVCHTI
jgi:hypothetical protein